VRQALLCLHLELHLNTLYLEENLELKSLRIQLRCQILMEDPFDVALERVFAVKLDDAVVRVLHILDFLGEHLHCIEVRHVFREFLVQLLRDLLVHSPLLLAVEHDSLVLNMALEQFS
jgi:hypothetical protein